MPNLFGRPLSSFLPFSSLVYHMDGPPNVEYGPKKHFFLYFVHVGYAAALPISLFAYSVFVSSTDSFNPVEQYRILKQRIKERETNEQKYKKLYKMVLGPGGIADTNFDLKVDNLEMIKMCQKLGFDENVLVPGKEFPKPTIEQLEKIVKEYGGDN